MPRGSPITLCGSLSLHPVSLGASLHTAGYRALGLDFVYVPFAIRDRDADLAAALAGMRALAMRGFGVSMPFKLMVIPHLDRLDPLAERIGAVNTIVNDRGVLTGYNTDAWGAKRALEEAISLPERRILVIGAGGAARAVAHVLVGENACVHIVNRTAEKAAELARQLNASNPNEPVTSGALAELRTLEDFDAIVNCSSAGMAEYGPDSPIPSELLTSKVVVMDIVYKPLQTRLLSEAAARGARTVHGGRMLLHQACGQFELYTGRSAPLAAMNQALQAAL